MGFAPHAGGGGWSSRAAKEKELWTVIFNRQDAALEALRLLERPAHIDEIVALLRDKGRDDTYPLVSAALSALKRKEIVQPEGNGVWSIVPPNQEAFARAQDEMLAAKQGRLADMYSGGPHPESEGHAPG